MSRTIELGRAVLATSTSSLELWLTTLITISPGQCCISIDRISGNSILDILSSGSAWVGRGSGLQVELDITWRGERLPQLHLQELVDGILGAPVWEQLMLQPSLLTDLTVARRKVHIGIRHVEGTMQKETNSTSKFTRNIAMISTEPPNSVPRFSIDSVQLFMDILEAPRRPRLKRLRTSPSSQGRTEVRQASQLETQRDPLNILHEATRVATAKSASQKPGPYIVQRQIDVEPGITHADAPKVPRPHNSPEIKNDVLRHEIESVGSILLPDEQRDLEMMVDAAMRLSVSGSFSRPTTELKLKANTFRVSLADVAPILWKPGYLQAFTQRASLLSDISHSITQMATMKATSMSLNAKMITLKHRSPCDGRSVQSHKFSTRDDTQMGSTVSDQLWLYLQRKVATRSTQPLREFVMSRECGLHDSDEILLPPNPPGNHIDIPGLRLDRSNSVALMMGDSSLAKTA